MYNSHCRYRFLRSFHLVGSCSVPPNDALCRSSRAPVKRAGPSTLCGRDGRLQGVPLLTTQGSVEMANRLSLFWSNLSIKLQWMCRKNVVSPNLAKNVSIARYKCYRSRIALAEADFLALQRRTPSLLFLSFQAAESNTQSKLYTEADTCDVTKHLIQIRYSFLLIFCHYDILPSKYLIKTINFIVWFQT